MSLVAPVYDRTQQDIANRTAKAFLNVADYQRIEANLQYLAGLFGIEIAGQEWDMWSHPSPARLDVILKNLQAVKDAYFALPTTPETPELPINHFNKVNDIERIIWQLWYLWNENRSNSLYCGEFAAGEEIGVL
jgi:hypothetical protein